MHAFCGQARCPLTNKYTTPLHKRNHPTPNVPAALECRQQQSVAANQQSTPTKSPVHKVGDPSLNQRPTQQTRAARSRPPSSSHKGTRYMLGQHEPTDGTKEAAISTAGGDLSNGQTPVCAQCVSRVESRRVCSEQRSQREGLHRAIRKPAASLQPQGTKRWSCRQASKPG